MSSEGVSALDKNDVICPRRAVLPIRLGTTACCRLKWPFGALFWNLNLQGRAWEPIMQTIMAVWRASSFRKSAQTDHYYLQRAATPDHITQQNRLQLAGGP
jgi:hypothetical protein